MRYVYRETHSCCSVWADSAMGKGRDFTPPLLPLSTSTMQAHIYPIDYRPFMFGLVRNPLVRPGWVYSLVAAWACWGRFRLGRISPMASF